LELKTLRARQRTTLRARPILAKTCRMITEQDDGQNMNEDPDFVQPVLQDFRYPWKFVS
jgi:hypothetical protein